MQRLNNTCTENLLTYFVFLIKAYTAIMLSFETELRGKTAQTYRSVHLQIWNDRVLKKSCLNSQLSDTLIWDCTLTNTQSWSTQICESVHVLVVLCTHLWMFVSVCRPRHSFVDSESICGSLNAWLLYNFWIQCI